MSSYKITKSLLTLNQDIAGQEIGIPVYQISCGLDNAPKVYIQSAVHAAEMQGSAVIFQFLKMLASLELFADFVLVPNCNPFGRTQRAGEYLQGRFDATTGNNWNRFYHFDENVIYAVTAKVLAQRSNWRNDENIKQLFRRSLQDSLESLNDKIWGVNTAQFLNHKLQSMALEADYVIDLHTGPSSTRHIYSPDYDVADAKLFNIENIISIPAKFAGALDEASFVPWAKLATELKSQGVDFNYKVRAFTVELGSQENICLKQAEKDLLGILNYLNAQGLISGNPLVEPRTCKVVELASYKTMFSKYAGMVEYIAKAGDYVEKGQVIARVLNSLEFDNEKGMIEITSPESGIVILHYPSAAVQVGTQLYKIAIV